MALVEAVDKPSPLSSTSTSVARSQNNSSKMSKREEILLLKRCIPTNTELLRIMDANPREGEQLTRYCEMINEKIRELEEEHRRTVLEKEQQKRDEAKERAQLRYAQKKEYVIQQFMDKNLCAEDRLAEQAAERQRQLQKKEAIEFVARMTVLEQREAKRQKFQEQTLKRKEDWAKTVQHAEEQKRQQREEYVKRSREEELLAFKRAEELKAARLAEKQKLREKVQYLDTVAAHHSLRAQQHIQMKQSLAARLANAPLLHPTVKDEKLEELKAKVAAREEAGHQGILATMSSQVARIAILKAERAHRLHEAKTRIDHHEAKHEERLTNLEEQLRMRLRQHTMNMQQRQQMNEDQKLQKREKEQRCKSAVAQRLEDGHAKLAQKLIDRTLRIGAALGVELPPLLPSGYILIEAQPSRDFSRSRTAEPAATEPLAIMDKKPTTKSQSPKKVKKSEAQADTPNGTEVELVRGPTWLGTLAREGNSLEALSLMASLRPKENVN